MLSKSIALALRQNKEQKHRLGYCVSTKSQQPGLSAGLSVFPHQLCFLKHMALHGLFNLIFCGAGGQFELGVQRVKIKVVTMSSGWWAGAAIAGLSKIVLARNAAARKVFSLWSSLRDMGNFRRNV